jgi:phosphatidylglycerol---prolipoprotein diacylglyceryl transferase
MYAYGLIISLSISICLLLAEKRAKADGKPSKMVWDIGLNAIVCGLIGARAYHVADYWQYYANSPITMLYFWQGGLGIWGALVGGAVGLLVYFRQKNLQEMRYWFDLIASVLPLGQAIGRLGNYANQENYGLPTNLPWKIFIDTAHRMQGYENVAFYHPLFLYEAVLNFFLFLFLRKLQAGTGKITSYYLIGYGMIRFFVEFLRLRTWTIENINVAQIISVAMVMIGIALLKKYQNLKNM